MEQASSHSPSRRLAIMLAALVAVGPFAIDTYLPAFPTMAEYFGVSTASIQLSISFFFIGSAIGQVVGGPISDRIGRRPVALAGLVIYTITSFLIVFAPSVELLWLLRFIQALGGGAAVVISAATVRDCYSGREAARMLSLISMIMLMAPLVAPGVGSLLLALQGWKSVFVLLTVYGSLLMLMVIFQLPETLNKHEVRQDSGIRGVMNSYGKILGHGKAMGFILCTGFSLGCLFTFLTGSSFTYIEYFGVSTTIYPIMFGSSVMLYMVFNRINMRLLNKREPEKLIPVGMIMQFTAALLLLGYVVFFEPRVEVVYFLVLMTISAIGFIAANATSCTLRYFPDDSGTANAVIGTLNFGLGGLVGILMSLLHDGTLVPIAMVMVINSVLSIFFFNLGMRVSGVGLELEKSS
ncbi:MAG: multidrug effflux MFS transporter [Endozoicomonas sp.]